jgi:hypothetical protein
MTKYFTRVSDTFLSEILDGGRLPTGFRLVREVGPSDLGSTLVEFEDDAAPAHMEGCVVTPVFTRDGGRFSETSPTQLSRVWISARVVESRPAPEAECSAP